MKREAQFFENRLAHRTRLDSVQPQLTPTSFVVFITVQTTGKPIRRVRRVPSSSDKGIVRLLLT
jgi:uncharacterized membrane protein YjjP (DUF1212 family)